MEYGVHSHNKTGSAQTAGGRKQSKPDPYNLTNLHAKYGYALKIPRNRSRMPATRS